MSHQCLIIEDDLYTANDVKDIIEKAFPSINCLDIVSNTGDAKLALDRHQPDLVLSDINLGEDTIFSLLKSYNTLPFKIIFITSYSKYAVEAFKFSALDFIEKPFDDDGLIAAVKNAISLIDQESYNKQIQTFFHNFNPNQKNKRLVLKNIEAVHIVSVDAIIYVKSDNNYSEFYINDDRKIVVSKPLKFYNDQLQSYSFFRTHQSYLANLTYAKTFHKRDSVLELSNGKQLPVSSNKTSALLHNLSSFF